MFEFLQCDVWIKLFLYLKTSIASNKLCADSEKSCFYDHIGRASAVIKMQAPSEDWTHDIEILYELIYNNLALRIELTTLKSCMN